MTAKLGRGKGGERARDQKAHFETGKPVIWKPLALYSVLQNLLLSDLPKSVTCKHQKIQLRTVLLVLLHDYSDFQESTKQQLLERIIAILLPEM